MNMKQIRELVQLFSENGLNVLEISEGELHVRLERNNLQAVNPAPVQPTPAVQPAAPASPEVSLPAHEADPGINFSNVTEVKSPMVGVFYAAPSPDAEPFVKVGSRVKKGDVLCIVEAMKLMNEIVAEQDGEIVDRCVENGDVVEFGQTLFKIY